MAMTLAEGLLLALALILPLLGLGIALLVQGARRGRELASLRGALNELAQEPGAASSAGALSEPEAPRVALVVNPIKFDNLSVLRHRATKICRDLGHGVPLWLETAVDDPGYGQALEALNDGAQIIIAAGGDGTVRSVARALTGSEAKMAIIPGGTGNLLARNIGIPLDDYDLALTTALMGTDRRVDVGWLRAGQTEEEAERSKREIFLVMAGIGFDALIMSGASDHVKKNLGWIAYVISGARRILGKPVRVVVSADDGPPHRLRARTVLFGNVGRLMGGIDLMPDAALDSGRLDALALNWRGFAGFGAVATSVMNPEIAVNRRISGLDRYEGTQFRVEAEKELPFELDGDPAGEARVLLAEVEPAALTVSFPLGTA